MINRRKSERRPILNSFSISVVVPKKGFYRLKLHDISASGVGFDLDIEGEPLNSFDVKVGETLELQFYLNTSLFIPLEVKITRIEAKAAGRHVGAEILDTTSKNYRAFQSFIHMIDQIAEVGQFEKEPD